MGLMSTWFGVNMLLVTFAFKVFEVSTLVQSVFWGFIVILRCFFSIM